ncbi:synaptotagmin-like protein 4 isoform X1 [Osmerus mordax]|uniref:synaptotagmin-like protein 4 isoform X1 n=1 Tax=Osmerus mordax TaxID=8014 RepID=UPI00350F7CCD
MENRSEERLHSRSDDECSDHSLTKSSSRTPPIEGGKQAGPPHLIEVPSEPYIFKQTKPASRKGKEIQEPKPTEIKSHSDLPFRPLQSTPGYNPFSTSEVPISVGSTQQSPQDKSQSIKPVGKSVDTDNSLDIRDAKSEITILSSFVNPSMNDKVELSITPAENRSMDKDVIRNLSKDLYPDTKVVGGDTHHTEKDQSRFTGQTHEKTPKEVKLTSDISQGMSEEHMLVVKNTEFQFVPTPSIGLWEGGGRIEPESKQENLTIGETVSTKIPFVGDTQNRSVEKLNAERDVERKSSSRTPPVEGGKQAGQPHFEKVPSEPYILRQPKPEEARSHSELPFSLLQSTPGYNPFSTTDQSMSVRSPQQSAGEKSQSIKPIDQPFLKDDSHAIGEVKYKMTTLSSPVNPPVVVASVNEEVELAITPAEDSDMENDEAVNNLKKDLYPDTEVVGDKSHDTEKDQRVFPEVLDVGKLEHVQIPVKVEREESTESQSEAIVKAPIAVNVKEMERPKEEATSETEMFLIADSVVTKSSKVPAEVSTQQANQEAGKYPIPTILLNSSQSPITEEVKGLGHRRKVLEVSSVSGSSLGNLENETVDSDDDHTSVSSQGSDFSDRQGYGSTLSLSHSGRTGSMLSVYSDAGDFGNVTVQGAVEFALRYSKEGEFIVTVEQCLDLAFANARKKRTDPYVKTYLHPDKSHSSKKKTSIKKRTTNPVYGGETLKYKIKMEELKGRTLNLSVWHNDSRGRNVFLGQVEINLKTWDWGHEALTWYNMQPKSSEGQEVSENHGVLTVALKYLPPGSAGIARPDSGEIHVWLKEARELRKLKAQGVDSFVKCYMLPDTSKKSRQKTRVMKKSQEPVYNHAMVYDGFRDDEVREACCELTVWDQNKLSNQFLGGVRLSLGTGQSYGKKVDWMDSWDQEIGLWEKMLASPTSWVEGEMPLRSAMTPRKKSLR